MKTKSNKTIVLECYRKIIRDLDLSVVDQYIHNNYIQHSPTVKDGKAGLLEMLGYLKAMPTPAMPAPSPIIRMIEEGDLVAVHLDVRFMGKRWAVVDLYRLENGMLAEHWDAGQEQLAEQRDLITVTNGSTVIEDIANADENKRLIVGMFDGNNDFVKNLLTPGFIGHSADDALQSVCAYSLKLHRVLSEGNFVITHSEAVDDGIVFSRFDIFKLEDGRIAEHWSVKQQVPDVMAHGNGMF